MIIHSQYELCYMIISEDCTESIQLSFKDKH